MNEHLTLDSTPKPKVTGLNHITLAVSDLDRSALPRPTRDGLARNLAGGRLFGNWAAVALLVAGQDGANQASLRLHAFGFRSKIKDFDRICETICAKASIWRENTSEGPSLYFLDPDGHKLEIHVGLLATRLADWRVKPRPDQKIFIPTAPRSGS